MKDKDDEELERIRRAKLQELKKSTALEKQTTALNRPVEVTDATFKEIVRNNQLVVVDCWASWCGPCHMITPVVEEMARDYAGRVLFGKLNVDENREVSELFGIVSIPTLLVFKNGELVDTIIGAMPRQMLEPKLRKYL